MEQREVWDLWVEPQVLPCLNGYVPFTQIIDDTPMRGWQESPPKVGYSNY